MPWLEDDDTIGERIAEVRPEVHTGITTSRETVVKFRGETILTHLEDKGQVRIGLAIHTQAEALAILQVLLTKFVALGTLDDSIPLADTMHHIDMTLAGRHSPTATPW